MDAQIAVLAGGRGERIGGAKATAALAGRPLISYPVEAAIETGLPAFVVAKPETELPELDVPVLREPAEPHHPLLGVVSAIEQSAGAPVVAVGCDLPFATPALIAWLGIQTEPVVVPRLAGRIHGTLARYAPEALPGLSAALRAGRPVTEAVELLGPRLVEARELGEFGDPERLLFNVNTPEDLAEAEWMLRRDQAGA